MNDPGATRTTFSDLAKSTAAQEEFFESLVTFLQNNGFDGVDIDWEYPMADDRTLDFCFPFLRHGERHAPKAPPANFKT